ncbi:unnamed protein product [Brassicogethes aeneus]|uniref:Carboxypeptidase Q n=1 Tax=Brassicogethes aeneus TaxID=1431903 RepID=A0A9P0BBP6_BRAAE|nr:unnamed protein product [Brassicogethes aeneus]
MVVATCLLVLAVLLLTGAKSNITNNKIDDACNLPDDLIKEIRSYEPIVEKIIGATMNGKFKGATYNELTKFVDKFGPRVSGTKNLEDSIDHMLDLLKKNNLDNVHGEEVQVPHWVRGEEEAWILEPRLTNLPVLGLGFSVSTPEEGITAEVLVVKSFEELNQSNFTEKAKGKIIVFNNDYVTYGVSVKYRSLGASRAAEKGGVAALVRSVTNYSQRTLHTGMQSYESGVRKIPVASITVEDARFLQRLQDRGEKIVVKLKLMNVNNKPKTSRNTVSEIKGSQKPEKVVLVSGHLDSWDVGNGAMDDGGGAFISWYSLVVLRALNLTPKRTVRCVLWTGEEFGLTGVIGYNATHANELDNFTFVMESDEGTFTPQGLVYSAGKQGGCILQEVLKLMASINATRAEYGASCGSDISIWTGNGIPGASLLNDAEKYFWYHHSAADTIDVENPDDLDKGLALWASVAYIIADLSLEFPRERVPDSIEGSLLLKALNHHKVSNGN